MMQIITLKGFLRRFRAGFQVNPSYFLPAIACFLLESCQIINKLYIFNLPLDFDTHFVVYSFQQQTIQQNSSDDIGVAGFCFNHPLIMPD